MWGVNWNNKLYSKKPETLGRIFVYCKEKKKNTTNAAFFFAESEFSNIMWQAMCTITDTA